LGLGKDEIVFVTNIHPVKSPKTVFPSEVWLLKVNSLLIGNAHVLYLSERFGFVLAETLADREVCLLRRQLAVIADEVGGQMVQGRPQIMDGIADNQTDNRINLGNILDHVIGVVSLRIVMGPKSARVLFEKDVSPRIVVSDVVVGPVNF
jgi:hypothetical protein